jgi:hypothetical protein
MNIEYLDSITQNSDDSDVSKSPSIPPITSQNEADGATFNDILNSADGVTTFGTAASSNSRSVDLPTHSLSDVILQRADNLGLSFQEKVENVNAMINSGPDSLSLKQLLQAQLSMTSITLEMDLVSGGVHKVTQYIDQLSKLN